MRKVFAILMAGCVRHGVDIRVIDVREPIELPHMEPLAVDPWPTPPDDVFIELARAPHDLYAGAILSDGSVRLRVPGGQGCAGGLAPDRIASILRIVDRIGFWSMKPEYPAIPSGVVPAYRITVNARGRRKTVVHFASEHSAVVRGELKGWPDIGDRLGLTELENALEEATHFDAIAYVRPIDLERRGLDTWRVHAHVEDTLAAIHVRCGALQATAIQIAIRADGAVKAASIPGGALDECADEMLRDIVFEPSCSGNTALFTLDAEGLHAEVHTIAPGE